MTVRPTKHFLFDKVLTPPLSRSLDAASLGFKSPGFGIFPASKKKTYVYMTKTWTSEMERVRCKSSSYKYHVIHTKIIPPNIVWATCDQTCNRCTAQKKYFGSFTHSSYKDSCRVSYILQLMSISILIGKSFVKRKNWHHLTGLEKCAQHKSSV